MTVPEPLNVTFSAYSAGAGVPAPMTTLPLALPLGPLQFKTYVFSPLGAMTLRLPEMALMPDQAPEAAQLVASLLDQVIVDGVPLVTLTGLALRDRVAAWAKGEIHNSARKVSASMSKTALKLLRHPANIGFCMVLLLKKILDESRAVGGPTAMLKLRADRGLVDTLR